MSNLFQPLSGMLPQEILNRLNTLVGGILGDSYNPPVSTQGIIPSARLAFATDASNADTITIGGQVVKFLTTLIAADTTIQVKRGVSAAATLAALVDGINGVANANVVQPTTAPTFKIVADSVTTNLRIRLAATRGTPAIAGVSASVALLESLTPAGDIWDAANLNVSGKTPESAEFTSDGSLAITAEMITAGHKDIELPFTPTGFTVSYASATGVPLATTDGTAISGNALRVSLGGGGAPALIATDVVTFHAFA